MATIIAVSPGMETSYINRLRWARWGKSTVHHSSLYTHQPVDYSQPPQPLFITTTSTSKTNDVFKIDSTHHRQAESFIDLYWVHITVRCLNERLYVDSQNQQSRRRTTERQIKTKNALLNCIVLNNHCTPLHYYLLLFDLSSLCIFHIDLFIYLLSTLFIMYTLSIVYYLALLIISHYLLYYSAVEAHVSLSPLGISCPKWHLHNFLTVTIFIFALTSRNITLRGLTVLFILFFLPPNFSVIFTI